MLSVSLAQLESIAGDPSANLNSARKAIMDAPGQVVVLPELFDTGYDLDLIPGIDMSAVKKYRETLCALSSQTGKSIVSGCLAGGASKLRNQAVVFQGGDKIGCYTKLHLCQTPPVDEDAYFEAGDDLLVVDIHGWRIGLAICYDLRFAALFQAYRRSNVDAIILISAWPVERGLHWDTLLRARAIESQCFVLACGLVGKVSASTFYGSSLAFDPWGNQIASCDAFLPQLVNVTLNKSKIDRYRRMHPLIRHERTELYAKWLKIKN